MRCKRVRRELSLAALEKDPGLQGRLLRRHLAACFACRAALTEMRRMEALVGDWRSGAPTPDLHNQVQTALGEAVRSHSDTTATALRQPWVSFFSLAYWVREWKENSIMRRRFTWSMLVAVLVTAGLMSSTLWHASALTHLNRMKSALQGVHSAHVSIWENTSLPDGKFYRRELWVQGSLLRQYIPGKLWMISSPDKNWYYIAEEDHLKQEAHKQAPVTFDFSVKDFKGVRGDGKGVVVEALRQTTLRGRNVLPIQVTELAPTWDELAAEKARDAQAQRDLEASYRQKGLPPPDAQADLTTTRFGAMHSRRSIYWVDQVSNLPLRSEEYAERQGRWELLRRSNYIYDEAFPSSLFSPQDLLRVGRLETKRPTKR